MYDLKYVLNCQICTCLMSDPTTLQCGHSFCRDCTIRWFFKYNKSNCPVCRQENKQEIPQVNVNLKQLIHYVTSHRSSKFGAKKKPRRKRHLIISWWIRLVRLGLFIFSPFTYFSWLIKRLVN